MTLTDHEYHAANDALEGYCTRCNDLTSSMTEPDAEGRDCPDCDGHTVMGVEQALLLGYVMIGGAV